jgi:hypothetical protein
MPVPSSMRRSRPAAHRVAAWAALLALPACGGEGGTAPERPLLAATPDPLVLLNETQQRLALVTREQRSLRRIAFWVDPLTTPDPWPISVDGLGVVTAVNTGRATVAVTAEADGADATIYVPVIVRGLRRPDFFRGPTDTLRLWLVPEPLEGFLADPVVVDTAPVAQGVRWTSSDTTVLAVVPTRRAVEGDGVRLVPRSPGRATLTVQSTVVPSFVLRRAVAVDHCFQPNRADCERRGPRP